MKQTLTEILGKGKVSDDPEALESYAEDHSFALRLKPALVVKPGNVDEVQVIVRWANRTRTPLVPVSSGPPRFHGDTVPGSAGAVMIDLSGMKKILRIDRRNRMALVEPGVTYAQLQPELAKAGLRLSTPLLPRANKSVVASLLEREPALVPRFQWAMLDPLRCLEIVWGDGNVFTTGEVSRPGSLEGEWRKKFAQVVPMGPAQTDFYKLVSAAQGSMGVVTWASIKCEVLPEIHRLFFTPSRRIEDLLDFIYRLLRYRFGDELLLLNGANLVRMLGESSEQRERLIEKLPPWVLLVGVAGRNVLPAERAEFQEKDIREMAQQCGLELVSAVPGAGATEVLEKVLNPSREPYWKLRCKGACRDIFFLTTINRTPEFIEIVRSVAEAHGYPASDIGVYIQPVHQGTGCHCEFSLPFDPESQKEVSGMREFFRKTSEELLNQGAFFSRPYGIWGDMAFNRDAQTMALLKKIKTIFDPNQVMNPGKLCF